MIKALIVEDEQVAANVLSLMINRHIPQIDKVIIAPGVAEARKIIPEFKPEIVFLDIEMPFQNGFELLKLLGRIDFDIVFTTAHDKYAILAIKFSALDYLLKPIDADELKEAFERFLQKRKYTVNKDEAVRNLLTNLGEVNKEQHKLALPSNNGIRFYYPQEIIRCEGLSNYTKFYFKDDPSLITSKTIKEYEEMLIPYNFIRTHKSHLVNASYVKEFDAQNLNLLLTDGAQIDISRRRKKEVLEELRLKMKA